MGLVRRMKEKRRIRRRHASYRHRRMGVSKFRSSNALPVIKLCATVVATLGAVALIVFVAVPAIGGWISPEPTPELLPNEVQNPLEVEISKPTPDPATQLQKEALIQFNAINDPYLCGEEIVFSTSTIVDGVSVFNQLHIYNTQTQSSEQVQGITLKYENLLFPKINEKYIVWLDSHPDGGGRICALDRATGKQFLIKEYAFALPQYSLSGNRIAFMQQAGNSLDKLYLYDLQTRESVALKVYTNLPAIPGTAHLSGNMLTWSVPKEANGTVVSTLYTYDLQTGQETPYDTGKLVTAPKSDGKNIAFLSSISGPADSLYVMDGQTAELIAQDVENYDVGDGFLVYTKEENLFLYGFASHEHRKINTELSRGLLVSVNGKQICWYDVTAGFGDIDVVRYADVSTLEV